MATKRVLRKTAPSAEPQPELEESWSDWLKGTYARYWYVLFCLFVDVVVGLEIFNRIDGVTGIVLAAVAVAALIALQVFIYVKAWGAQGRWAPLED
jgi:UDP-N-acetylmuramyl pentapeptide phosphotransferase/UDP-N-acetylglucosamine-1-phosphate transferase